MKNIRLNEIVKNEKIGAGSFSEVHRLKLNTKVKFNSTELDQIAIRIFRNGASNFEKIIETFNIVKKANFKTLSFVEKIKINNETVLAVEDLNNSNEIIFVSPNTQLHDLEKDKTLHYLSSLMLENEESKTDYKESFNSIAELYRKENLLIEITDFETDLDIYLSEIKQCSISKIELFTDCFFFSSSLIKKITKVNYVIADFDCIRFDYSFNVQEIELQNIKEFIRSYEEFIHKYFEESEKKKYYTNYLNEKLESLLKISPNI